MRAFDVFRFDQVNQSLWRGDARVALMPKPFAVLSYLVEHAGRLVTADELIEAIWPDTYVQPEVLRRYILEIRRALGDRANAPRYVQTFPKRGYQFIATVIDTPDEPRVRARPTENPSRPGASLVGRASELADLDRHLAGARTGVRQIVFVVGEPGIGKTSLVDVFQRAISGTSDVDVIVARGQAVEGFGGKEAYYPILEAINQLARGPERSLVIETLSVIAPTWLVQFPALIQPEQRAALQRELLGATRERMVRELCEALEAITERIPLVLLLEDLHWADRSTLDVISAIARRREPARLLVLGTLRPADVILSESPLKVLKHDLVLHGLSREVDLERLREPDVEEYLAGLFADEDVPPGLASAIYRHSDGNPLFMTAMLDHLARERVFEQRDGRWRMTVPLEQVDLGVPETLKQMLETELLHASDAEQQLLACASVVGQRFTVWSLSIMLQDDTEEIEARCDRLAARQQFLRVSGISSAGPGAPTAEYEFRHALYRDVLYRRLKARERVTYHRRLAEGLVALGPTTVKDQAAEIALHFEEGQAHERALYQFVLAAECATRQYAHAHAIAMLEHAQTLLPKLDAERAVALELQILERIGNAAYALGEMELSARTYGALATRAAEVGLLVERADALLRLSYPAEAIPFFLKAVEIEPDFALAYVSLSRIFSNLGDADRAHVYAQHAFDRHHLVDGRERLSIVYQYHYEVTGDQARASATLDEWKVSFPTDHQPVNSLAVVNNFLGRFEQAVDEGTEAVRRNPSHGYPYSTLAHAYRGLGRFREAKLIAERAVRLEIETLPTRRLLYQLAVLADDQSTAAQHLEWARDRPREFDMVGARAQVAAWYGRINEARQLYESSARLAEQRQLHDVGTGHLAWATVMELAYGHVQPAARLARRVLDRSPSYDPRLRAALALGLSGSPLEARAIADEVSAARPDHTVINAVLAPVVRAAAALAIERPAEALEHLQIVEPYELGFIAALAPVYLRGLSYLSLHDGRRAAGQFQRLLDHRGSDPFSPFVAVAPLGLARAYHQTGESQRSLRAYDDFLAAWASADPDTPVLVDARRERDRILSGRSSAASVHHHASLARR